MLYCIVSYFEFYDSDKYVLCLCIELLFKYYTSDNYILMPTEIIGEKFKERAKNVS